MKRTPLLFLLSLIFSFSYAAPKWMHDQVQEDLAYFHENKLTRSDLIGVFKHAQKSKQSLCLVLFELKNGQLTTTPDSADTRNRPRYASITQHIQHFVKNSDLPDTTFLLTLKDGWFDYMQGNLPVVPIFAPCGYKETNKKSCCYRGTAHTIPFPDFEALGLYSRLKENIKRHDTRWKSKKAKAFWRGSTTGAVYTSSNCYDTPRSRLVLQSIQNPSLISARFTNYCQFVDPKFIPEFQVKCPPAPRVSQVKHLQYRYMVDVDGNTNSWSRMYWTLLCNSVLLKQSSPWYQWYYKAIKPWKHYIPLAEDVSDIKDKIIWAKRHDKEAQKIAKNATAIVEEIFTEKAIRSYIHLLLKEYAKCLKEDE